MPAKAPIYLKPNSGKNGPRTGKNGQKLREILSAEMISRPLDFRHKAHVGRGGADDMFGDTTFLNQKNAKETATTNGTTDRREGIMTFHSMRRKGKSSKKDKNSGTKSDVKSLSNQSCEGYGITESPILQSAFSLPLLHQDGEFTSTTPEKDDKGKRTKKTMNNNHIANGKAVSHDTGLNNGVQTPNGISNVPTKPRRLADADEHIANGHCSNKPVTVSEPAKLPMSDTTSIDEGWELDLDLGTSLMDDVMGIMDKIEL